MSSFDGHPLKQLRRPLIATRPIQRCAEFINTQIENDERGTDLFGDARIGKDWAINYLFLHRGWSTFPASCFTLNFPKTTQLGDGYFFNSCLLAGGQRFIGSSPGNFTQSRMCNFLLEELDKAGNELLLFRVSEANRMLAEHWDHLVTLDNDLEKAGKRMFLVSLHQTDATSAGVEGIDLDPLPQIRGRFRMQRHRFTGLLWDRPTHEIPKEPDSRDLLGDVDLALACFDEDLIWPHGSGVSYSRYFASKAYDRGWRFAKHRDEIRKAVETLRVNHHLTAVAPWPMKTFMTFVSLMLVRIAGENINFSEFTTEDIERALKLCGYIELELSRGPKVRA